MITMRRSEARRHVRSASQDTWLTFDPENEADPFRRGFRALEALNEETPVSEMNLSGNHLEIWKKLLAVGNDPFPYSSMRPPTLEFDGVSDAGT